MITLEKKSHPFGRDCRSWVKAKSFAINPRGILTHRTKRVETFYRDGKKSHHHVGYWCGNGTCFEIGNEEVLTDDPPKDRLLCLFCEAKAQANGQKKADKLAGRHVHRGVLKAVQVCCRRKP